MKNIRRFTSLLIALLLTFSMSTACSAAEEESSRIRLSWDGKEVVVLWRGPLPTTLRPVTETGSSEPIIP